MAVRDKHHAAREVVVFQKHLVADAGARGPEVKAVAARNRAQERVRFPVTLVGNLQVRNGAAVSLHEMVAHHGRGKRNAFFLRGQKLNDRHRAADVVRARAVRTQFNVVLAAGKVLHRILMVKVRVDDLFRERQRAV